MLMILLKCYDQQVFVPTPGLIAWPGPSVHSREPRKSSALNTSSTVHCTVRKGYTVQSSRPGSSWYWERRAWALRSQGWWVVGAAVIMEQRATTTRQGQQRQPLYRERATLASIARGATCKQISRSRQWRLAAWKHASCTEQWTSQPTATN